MNTQATQPTPGKKGVVLRPVQVLKREPDRQNVFSLALLQAQCEKKKAVHFTLDGLPYSIEVRTLLPEEDAQLDQLLDSVIPPMKAATGAKPGDPMIPDIANPDYQKRKNDTYLTARALALYWAVPVFSAEKPGLKTATEITEFVQKKLTTQLLDILFNGVRNGRIELAALVNFT
jgi:hypothetical protein